MPIGVIRGSAPSKGRVSEDAGTNQQLQNWSPRHLFGTFVDAKWWGGLARGVRGGIALVLICLLVQLPGLFSIPVVDRDESRFAQATRQMVESGTTQGWIVPMVQDKPRLNKPPLIYWLQSASVEVGKAVGIERASEQIWLYRIPSLLAALIAVLATWRLGVVMFDPRAGWLGALLLAICPMVVWESKQGRSDMVLFAATTVAQWALFRLWHVDHDSAKARKALGHWRLVFWGAMAVGVMVKGPITPLVCALTVASLWLVQRSRGVMRRMWLLSGTACVLGAIGIWAALAMRQVGVDTYLQIISDETLGRVTSSKEGHWGPPGYHLLLFPALFWPGSLVTGLALARTWKQGLGPTESRDPAARRAGWFGARFLRAIQRRLEYGAQGRQAEVFLMAWLLAPWIMFELISTKLPHYTLPLYPALALMSARAVFTASCGVMDSVPKLLSRLGYVGWAIIGAVMSVAPLFVWWYFGVETTYMQFAIALLPIALMLITLAIAWNGIFRGIAGGKNEGRFLRAQTASAIGAGLTWMILCGMVLPSTRLLWTSHQLREVLMKVDPEGLRPVVTVEAAEDASLPRDKKQTFAEDSLIFETGGRATRIAEADFEKWLEAHPDGLVVMPKKIADRKTGITRLGEVSGFNYSLGNRVYLTVCELPHPARRTGRAGAHE